MRIQCDDVKLPTAFASCSISSRNGDTLLDKMESIREAGFEGMELAMPDILAFGKALTGEEVDEHDQDSMVLIARQIKRHAQKLGLTIVMLQPFSRFEGLPQPARREAFARASRWMAIMQALGTDMLQVGSSDAEDSCASIDVLASDLAELADLLSQQDFRVAYENWCWATHVQNWQRAWQVVSRANRDNLGLCLDTFQIAGSSLTDPTTASGLVETMPKDKLDILWMNSLAELMATLPPEKIFILQVSDGYRMTPPIGSDDGVKTKQRPKAQWSHAHRPLPFHDGYLPVQEIFDSVLSTGFRGWLSVEVFDPEQEMQSSNREYAREGKRALDMLLARKHIFHADR